MSEEWSSPDVSFRIETKCFGGNRRFHSGAGFKGRRCGVLYLFFQLKMALPVCALAIKALAVSARAAPQPAWTC